MIWTSPLLLPAQGWFLQSFLGFLSLVTFWMSKEKDSCGWTWRGPFCPSPLPAYSAERSMAAFYNSPMAIPNSIDVHWWQKDQLTSWGSVVCGLHAVSVSLFGLGTKQQPPFLPLVYHPPYSIWFESGEDHYNLEADLPLWNKTRRNSPQWWLRREKKKWRS